jgi:hypothetical protein
MGVSETAPIDADRREARWRAVSAEHGIAALRYTHWLGEEARPYEGAPGVWSLEDGRAVGRGLQADAPHAPFDVVALGPGDVVDSGRIRLTVIHRGGALALRVFDPDHPGRTRLRGIRSFPYDPRWTFRATFEPAADGATRVVRSVDGSERDEPAVGSVVFALDGADVRLTVSRGAGGLSAVIADATSGVDAYRFRFLPIDAPGPDGRAIVDFNRAYLPPCAFSDQYVCPLPPPENRLDVRIEAGERLTELAL